MISPCQLDDMLVLICHPSEWWRDAIIPVPVPCILEFHYNSPVLSRTFFDKNVLHRSGFFLLLSFYFIEDIKNNVAKVSVLQSRINGLLMFRTDHTQAWLKINWDVKFLPDQSPSLASFYKLIPNDTINWRGILASKWHLIYCFQFCASNFLDLQSFIPILSTQVAYIFHVTSVCSVNAFSPLISERFLNARS